MVRIAGLVVFAIVSTGSSCLSPTDDKCKSTEASAFETNFLLHITVSQNGAPYLGPMTTTIEKVYCGGKIGGSFPDTRASGTDGSFTPYLTSFKLANKEDFVRVRFTAGSYHDDWNYTYQRIGDNLSIDWLLRVTFEATREVIIP